MWPNFEEPSMYAHFFQIPLYYIFIIYKDRWMDWKQACRKISNFTVDRDHSYKSKKTWQSSIPADILVAI